MNQLSQIAPVTDAEAARMVSPDTIADLAMRITAMPPEQRRHVSERGERRRRPLLLGIPLAAAAAAAALVIASLGGPAHQTSPGHRTNPAAAPASQTQVLSFVTNGTSTTVLVRNPLADPSRYRAEFAQHHLDISLKLIPVSPSLVGTLVFIGEYSGASNLTPLTAKGRCYTGGGGSACPVGVRIPAGFHGQADLVFGRAAKPGEHYESTASALAPGEAMHGMNITGETVSQVLAQLHARHVTVPVFDYMATTGATHLRPGQVPGSWHVYDAVPWAPGQVMLFVGPNAKQPASGLPSRATAIASPASTTK
jgi:hypothetical protein